MLQNTPFASCGFDTTFCNTTPYFGHIHALMQGDMNGRDSLHLADHSTARRWRLRRVGAGSKYKSTMLLVALLLFGKPNRFFTATAIEVDCLVIMCLSQYCPCGRHCETHVGRLRTQRKMVLMKSIIHLEEAIWKPEQTMSKSVDRLTLLSSLASRSCILPDRPASESTIWPHTSLKPGNGVRRVIHLPTKE